MKFHFNFVFASLYLFI